MNKNLALQIGAWSLSGLTTALAIIVWGEDFNWHVSLDTYLLFPVLGLIAYSLMWSHYMAGTARELLGAGKDALKQYYRWTGFIVLALLLLHPGLLILQRFVDGYGLPPASYISYVAPGLGWITLLGSISLVIFLAYEFHRKYGERSWWHFVTEAGDFAMLAVFYHGLKLGVQLQHGWYQYVWWFYGITLVAVLIRSYSIKYFIPAWTKRTQK